MANEPLVPWEQPTPKNVDLVPWEQGAPAAKPVRQRTPLPDIDGVAAVQSVFPGTRINQNRRDPNSSLGRANPDSFHNFGRNAVDIPAIPGLTFEQAKKQFEAKGYRIHPDSRDEYTNPSAHATGGHWHFVFEGAPENGAPTAVSEDSVPWEQPAEFKPRMNTPVTPETAAVDRTGEWDTMNPLPEGTVIQSAEAADSKVYFENSLAMLHGKRKKVSKGAFIADIRKNAPNITADDETLGWYYDSYSSGRANPINYYNREADTSILDAEFKPTDAEGPQLSAPPPLSFTEVIGKTAGEMMDPAGTGLNAAFMRSLSTVGMSPEQEQRYYDGIRAERGAQERFWNDQSNRTDSPILDEVGKFIGASAGDVNPTYLVGGGGATVGRRIGAQALTEGATDLVTQGAENVQGLRDGIDPAQVLTNAAAGAAFQGVIGEPLQWAINKYSKSGMTPKTYDNPKVIELTETPSAPAAVPAAVPTPAGKKPTVRDKKKTIGEKVSTITKGWTNMPETVIHTSKKAFEKADPDLAKKVREDGASSAPGFYADDGRIHIIAENVKNDGQVESLIYHEALGHDGLMKTFRDDLDTVLTSLYEGNWRLRQEADKLAAGKYGDVYTGPDRLARLVEEVLAKRSEAGVISKGILDKIIPTIRKYGRELGLDLRYTDREVKAILADAHKMVVSGTSEAVSPSGLRYMYVGLRGASERENLNRRQDMEVNERYGLPGNDVLRSDIENNMPPENYYTALERAEAGEAYGPDSQIRKDTGWFVGPDNRWRREINDSNSAFDVKRFREMSETDSATLGDFLHHPELYRHYPDLKNLPLTRKGDVWDWAKSVQGWMDDSGLNITPYATEDTRSIVLHEIQHQIQKLEGFSSGGNTQTALSRLSTRHLHDVSKNVIKYYEKKIRPLEDKAQIYNDFSMEPLIQKYSELKQKLNESYDKEEPFEKRQGLLEEIADLRYDIFVEYSGEPPLSLKKSNKLGYDRLDEVLLRASSGPDGLTNEALRLAQKAGSIKTKVRNLKSNLNSDGTLVSREQVLKDLEDIRSLPFEAYTQLFGEVEARDTANRRNYDEIDRQATTPYTSEPDVDPTGYVFDDGMSGYGVNKSESRLAKYMLEEEDGSNVTDIRKARHDKTQKDNFFKTEWEDSPSLKELEDLIAEEESRQIGGSSPEVRDWLDAKKGPIKSSNDNIKYMLEEEDSGRAGSINLDKIVTKDGLNTHALYRAFAEGIDKESVTYEDAVAAVMDRGIQPSKKLKKQMKLDPTIGISAAIALEKGHQELMRVQKRLFTENLSLGQQQKLEAKAAYLIARQAEAQAELAGWRSNVGRALNFMKIAIDKDGPVLEKLFKEIGSAPLSNREVLYKFLGELERLEGNPKAQAKMTKDAFDPLLEDYFLSFQYSMMLYGLGTQAVNFVGNAGTTMLDATSSMLASIMGLRSKMSGEARVPLRAAMFRNLAMMKALVELQTWRDVGWSFLEGRPAHQVSKVEVGHNIFTETFGPAGTAIDLPQKALAASDSFWRSLLENAHLYEQAYILADKEGLKGAKLHDRVSEIIANPPEDIKLLVDGNVATIQLVDDPSPFTQWIERIKSRPKDRDDYFRRGVRFLAQMIFPFSRVTDNIVRTGIRHTPGLGMLDRQNLADFKAGGERRDKAIARQIVGGTIIAYLVNKAMAGELSGEGPENLDERRLLEASGWQPNSIKLSDGKWHSMQGLDAIQPMAGVIAGLMGDYKEGRLGKDDWMSDVINLPVRLGTHLSQNTFAEQAGQFLQMLGTGPSAKMAQNSFIPGLTTRAIPAFVRQYAEDQDGYMRDTSGTGTMSDRVAGRLKSSFPGLRETLPMRYDVFGRPVESNRPLFGLNREKTPDPDPIVREVIRLDEVDGKKGALVGPVDRGSLPEGPVKDAGRAEDVQALQKLSGEYIYADLASVVGTEEWKALDDQGKIKLVKKIVKDQRKNAKAELFPDPEEDVQLAPWEE